jgi:hypothetical protein
MRLHNVNCESVILTQQSPTMRQEPRKDNHSLITAQVMAMNGMWRFVGMVALAVVTAFATFQDRIALGIGTVGLAATVVVAALVLIGAGAALLQSTPRTAHDADADNAALEDGDEATTLGS